MTCKDFRDLLDDYLDFTLPQEQQNALDAHLKVCPHCQMLMQMHSDLQQLQKDAPLPETLNTAWRKSIRREKRWTALRQGTLAAAAMMAFLLGGTALHRQGSQTEMLADNAPMMLRAMPEAAAIQAPPENSMLTFIRDMGAFLLDALPFLGILAAAALLILYLQKRLSKRKE